jgi:glutamyl-Q tRNA(Asp) synthetase
MTATGYVGRFAPSPTGPLHFGSLVGALASYLDARHHQGKWLLRIEDIDPPREIPGSADSIIESLRIHGMEWDGEILYQSSRLPAYAHRLEELDRQGLLFACDCSRQQIRVAGGIYPGTCRSSTAPPVGDYALRLRTDDQCYAIEDIFQGHRQWQLEKEVGDFVIKRRDGLFAYQLAVVADDIAQGVTHVIRGSDILESTPRQLYLYALLGEPAPQYGHFPVVINPQGDKLSKQTGAPAVDGTDWKNNLVRALAFLRQPPIPENHQQNANALLACATRQWSRTAIPRAVMLPMP